MEKATLFIFTMISSAFVKAQLKEVLGRTAAVFAPEFPVATGTALN